MTLAEALARRKDLLSARGTLLQRIGGAMVHPQDEQPDDKAEELLSALDGTNNELTKLLKDINLTNTAVGLTELLAKRDIMMPMAQQFTQWAGTVRQRNMIRSYRQRGEEDDPKQVSQIPSSELQATADRLAAEMRELNNKIQALNYSTELIVS